MEQCASQIAKHTAEGNLSAEDQGQSCLSHSLSRNLSCLSCKAGKILVLSTLKIALGGKVIHPYVIQFNGGLQRFRHEMARGDWNGLGRSLGDGKGELEVAF